VGLEIALGFVVVVTVLAIGLAVRSAGERRQTADRRLAAGDSSMELPAVQLTAPAGVADSRSRFDTWFETAVRRSGLDASPAGVVAVMVLIATLLGFGLFFWKSQLGLVALGVLVGLGVPLAVVAYYSRRYRWRLQAQIPDAYRMLAGSVRAGQTLQQAIEFYAERGTKPLSEEFAHCAALMRLGMSPAAALQSTAPRVGLLDFDLLVSTVGLYTQTGGNLVLLLERLADSVRDRNRYRGQFLAATAQSRVVALAIGIVAPVLLLVYLLAEPQHVQTFLSQPSGWMVLAVCGLLEVIGIFWLWRILKVDY
jgi:tight adherence protein B